MNYIATDFCHGPKNNTVVIWLRMFVTVVLFQVSVDGRYVFSVAVPTHRNTKVQPCTAV